MADPSYADIREPGPFTADQVPQGSRYELSRGHPIYCAPSGGSHGTATSTTSLVLGTDPAVTEIGADVGFAPQKNQLRAPDIAVGNVPNKPGWAPGAPRLAVELADVGQDERDLVLKIQELFEAGTEQVWVVRLVGPQRVEVHRADGTTALYTTGQHIEAPTIVARPVLVDALFDPELAREVALENLLVRHGYLSLDAVRDEGRQEGELRSLRQALRAVLSARGLALTVEDEGRIDAAAADQLQGWISRAAVETQVAAVLR